MLVELPEFREWQCKEMYTISYHVCEIVYVLDQVICVLCPHLLDFVNLWVVSTFFGIPKSVQVLLLSTWLKTVRTMKWDCLDQLVWNRDYLERS